MKKKCTQQQFSPESSLWAGDNLREKKNGQAWFSELERLTLVFAADIASSFPAGEKLATRPLVLMCQIAEVISCTRQIAKNLETNHNVLQRDN